MQKSISKAARTLGRMKSPAKKLASQHNWFMAQAAIARKRAAGARWGGRKKNKKNP